jgi:hypothetical protein
MDVNKVNSKTELSSLLSEISIIELEGGVDKYFKEPARIRLFNNLLYVFDREMGNLFIFDTQGKFVKKVIQKGKGPGEAVKAYDFDIDTDKKQLLILDLGLNQVLYYSLDGEYLFNQVNNFQSFYFSTLGSGKVAFYIGYFDKYSYNLQIYEGKRKVASLFPFPEKMFPMHFPFTGYITRNKQGILYTDACSNNIYQVYSDGTSQLKYSFNFGNRTWKEDNRYDFNNFFSSISRFETDFLRCNFEESKEGLIFEYLMGNRIRTGYFFFSDSTLFLPDRNLVYNAFYRSFKPPRGIADDGRFISFFEPNSVKRDIVEQEKKGIQTGFTSEIRARILAANMETGMFVVLFKLRKNEN